jgi:hypothetical protein
MNVSFKWTAVAFFCFLCSCSALPQNPPLLARPPLRTGDAAADLYSAILNSAQSASGSFRIGLSGFDGRTSSKTFGQSGIWHIDASTIVRVNFSLQGEDWKSLSLDFTDHPISLQLAVDTPAPGFLQIGKITFGRDGKVRDLFAPDGSLVTDFDRQGLSGNTPIGFYTDLLSNIAVPPQLSAILAGRGLSKGPLVFSSAMVEEPKGDNLNLVLSPMATLPIGARLNGRCDPNLTFSQSIPIDWHALSYASATGHLEATIGSFVSRLGSGCVAAGGTELKIVSGNQLDVTSLEFGEPGRGTQSHVSMLASAFNGTLLPGSQTALGTEGTETSELTATTGGSVNAGTIEVGIREDGNGFLVLNNAQLALLGVSGELAPDAGDFFKFTEGESDLMLATATWVDSSIPKVTGTFTPGQVAILSGQLTFSAKTRVSLGAGSAAFGSLSIDSSGDPQISGAIVNGDIQIAQGSYLGVNGRFNLVLGTNGMLQIHSPDQIAFSNTLLGPHGRVTATAPVANGEIDLGGNGKLPVTSGQIQLSLTSNETSGYLGQIEGNLELGTGTMPLGGSVLVAVSNGELRSNALAFTATSGLSGPLSILTLALANSRTVTLSPDLAFTPTSGSSIENDASGQETELSEAGMVGGLKLTVSYSAGEADFSATSSFILADGQLTATLVRSPCGTVTGLFLISSNLTSGSVALNSVTALPVGSGSHIESRDLKLNADGTISGSLSPAHLVLTSGKTTAAIRGRTLNIADSSTYDSNPSDPLSFSENDTFPSGSGNLAAHFSQMQYQATPTVTLSNGELDAILSRSPGADLKWTALAITGEQQGSYQNVSELPSDEYLVQSRLTSGSVGEIIAPHRVMVVNNFPIAINSAASFDTSGDLQYATLARDSTIFGVPLLGGSQTELDVEHSMVLVGTLGSDTTIDGVPYSKGCIAHLPPTNADKQTPPCELVTSLAFRITTSNDFLSGANDPLTGKPDDIWLDIGPKAWMISGQGDFSKGATTTISVDSQNVDGGDCSALTPSAVPLYVGDIVKVRLEKKGISLPDICGVAEGPDSLVDPGLLLPTKPSDALNTMTAAIQLDREQLAAQKMVIDQAAQEISKLQDAINQAQAVIVQGAALTQKVADLENGVVNVQHQILSTPTQLCNNKVVSSGACWLFGPLCVVTKLECAANPLLQQLNDKVTQLETDVNNAKADVAAFTIRLQAAVAAKATNLQLQAVKEGALKADQLEYDALNKVADNLDSAISDLKTLIDQALPGIQIPLPGQWKPDSVTLVVNGRDYVTFNNNYGRLMQGHSEWEIPVRAMDAGEYFVQGMRVNINKPGCVPSGGEEECGWDTFLTTPFAKMRGFSGWDNISNLGNVTVTGVLRHDPSPGADVYVSFDLEVKSVEVNGRMLVLGDGSGIRDARYIRIEYLHESDQRFDSSHEHWQVGDTLRVTGPVKRDRDRTTFFEVHPLGSSNISRVSH